MTPIQLMYDAFAFLQRFIPNVPDDCLSHETNDRSLK